MKKLSTYLILIFFTLHTPSQADDIQDFQIEGMSIGNSALDFFTENQINNANKTIYPNSKKYQLVHILANSDVYDQFTFAIKPDDRRYIIYSLSGDIHFADDLTGCLNKKKEIVEEVSSSFTNIKEHSYTFKYENTDDGKSFAKITDFNLQEGSSIRIYCQNWSKETEEKRNKIELSFSGMKNMLIQYSQESCTGMSSYDNLERTDSEIQEYVQSYRFH